MRRNIIQEFRNSAKFSGASPSKIASASKNEKTPWHTDSNPLIDPYPTIVSVRLHSGGAFCFAPNYHGSFAGDRWHAKKNAKKKEKQCNAGVRGILPLFPGDLMVMVGSFHKHMVHKTLPCNKITREVIDGYPTVNQLIRASVGRLLEEMENDPQRRSVIKH